MKILENTPDLWRTALPRLKADGHKYDRGHAIVLGGGIASSGAARLSATAALRIGAGLVSIACDNESLPVYAASLMAVMTKRVDSVKDFAKLIGDARIKSLLLGPGAGVGKHTRKMVDAALAARKATVLDADALSSFAESPETLFSQLHGECILTPHTGEFAKLFPHITVKDKIKKAQTAAKLSHAIVVLKGAQTVIAAPDGRTVINKHASPYLATAGTGDVLAGMCAGLLAQGMPAFDAACAAVWMHGEAGIQLGAGMISEDLLPQISAVWKATLA